MTRLITADFFYLGQTYTAMASVMDQDHSSPVSVYLPDEALHHLLPGGKLSFDAKKGLQIDVAELSAAQELLVAVLRALQSCYGCPALNVNFKSASFPHIHPSLKSARMTLLMYIDNELIDTLQLNIPGVSDEEEDQWFIRNAMGELLDKWEDYMRGRSFQLEFYLTNIINNMPPGIKMYK